MGEPTHKGCCLQSYIHFCKEKGRVYGIFQRMQLGECHYNITQYVFLDAIIVTKMKNLRHHAITKYLIHGRNPPTKDVVYKDIPIFVKKKEEYIGSFKEVLLNIVRVQENSG